jgi:hypothetical protein
LIVLTDMRGSFQALALISEGLLSAVGWRLHDRPPSGAGLEGDLRRPQPDQRLL